MAIYKEVFFYVVQKNYSISFLGKENVKAEKLRERIEADQLLSFIPVTCLYSGRGREQVSHGQKVRKRIILEG